MSPKEIDGIVVIEDDTHFVEILLRYITTAFGEDALALTETISGSDAGIKGALYLAQLGRSEQNFLIISDVSMPKLSGDVLLRHNAFTGNFDFVLVSAFHRSEIYPPENIVITDGDERVSHDKTPLAPKSELLEKHLINFILFNKGKLPEGFFRRYLVNNFRLSKPHSHQSAVVSK